MSIFLKYQLAGLLGVAAHLLFNFGSDKRTENSAAGIRQWFRRDVKPILAALVAYEIVFILWWTGDLFLLFPYIPFMELTDEKIPMNYLIILVGMGGSSIVKTLGTAIEARIEAFRTKDKKH